MTSAFVFLCCLVKYSILGIQFRNKNVALDHSTSLELHTMTRAACFSIFLCPFLFNRFLNPSLNKRFVEMKKYKERILRKKQGEITRPMGIFRARWLTQWKSLYLPWLVQIKIVKDISFLNDSIIHINNTSKNLSKESEITLRKRCLFAINGKAVTIALRCIDNSHRYLRNMCTSYLVVAPEMDKRMQNQKETRQNVCQTAALHIG